MFDALFDGLAAAISFFYDVWPSYAAAIVLFTLAVMLITSPLSIKSTRSMIRMQRVQPEIKRLQQQYKGDREALNREMMAFYQANNINPLSSCLPMLLTMPVFIVLYQVLSGLTRKDANGEFIPKYLDENSALYEALHGAKKMMSFGMDLSRSALAELQDDGLIKSLPFFILIVAVVGTQWYQQRQIAGRRTGDVNPQQQMIARIFPLMMIPITLSVPAGVVIYFLVSNVVRVGQQTLITHLEYGDKAANVITPPPTAKPDKPSVPKPRPASGRVTQGNQQQRSRQRKRKRK